MNSESKLARVFMVSLMVTLASWSLAFVFSAFAGEKPFPEGTLKKVGERVIDGKPIKENMNTAIEGIDKITVKVRNSDVEVTSYEGTEVKVEFEGTVSAKENQKIIEITRSGNELTIETNKHVQSELYFSIMPGKGGFNVGGTEFLRLKVQIPKSFEKNLDVMTASGDVDLRGLKLNELQVKVASGDVELKDITAAATHLKTASGDTEVSNFNGDLELASASGDVKVRGIKGETLDIASASGDIEVEKADGKSIEVKATSGDIEIELADTKGWKYKLHAMSGDIENPFTDDEGGQKNLKATSLSGDITIKK